LAYCFLAHGHSFKGKNTHGQTTIDLLKPWVQKKGWEPRDFDYAVSILYSWHPAYWYHLGKKLANMATPGDILITSSAGASAGWMAMKSGARFETVIMISPVLRQEAVFPKGAAERIYILYSSADPVARGSTSAENFPFSPWGGMGVTGQVSEVGDARVENIDLARSNRFGLIAPGHCEPLYHLDVWGPQIMSLVPQGPSKR
jgi:hypothetical protein